MSRLAFLTIALVAVSSCVRASNIGVMETKHLTIVLMPMGQNQCRPRTNPPSIPVSKRLQQKVRWTIVDACRNGTAGAVAVEFNKGDGKPVRADCNLKGDSVIECELDPDVTAPKVYRYSVIFENQTEDPELQIEQ